MKNILFLNQRRRMKLLVFVFSVLLNTNSVFQRFHSFLSTIIKLFYFQQISLLQWKNRKITEPFIFLLHRLLIHTYINFTPSDKLCWKHEKYVIFHRWYRTSVCCTWRNFFPAVINSHYYRRYQFLDLLAA